MRCSFSGQLVWGRYELRFPTPGKVKPPRLDGVHRPIEWRFSPFTNRQWRGSRGERGVRRDGMRQRGEESWRGGRKEWWRGGYKFIVSHRPAGAGVSGRDWRDGRRAEEGRCTEGYCRLSGLRDRGDEPPTPASHSLLPRSAPRIVQRQKKKEKKIYKASFRL